MTRIMGSIKRKHSANENGIHPVRFDNIVLNTDAIFSVKKSAKTFDILENI